MADEKKPTIRLLDRDWHLPRYKLGALLAAAPFVDSQKARQAAISERVGVSIFFTDTPEMIQAKTLEIASKMQLEEMLLNMKDALSVLHVGIAKIDPTITLDMLVDDVDPTPAMFKILLDAMHEVMGQSGLTGEGAAPVAAEALPAADSSTASEA